MRTHRFVNFLVPILIFISACASIRNGGVDSTQSFLLHQQTPRGELIQAGGQRAVISMTLDVSKWKLQSGALFEQMPAAFQRMFPPEMQPILLSGRAPIDMLLNLIAESERTTVNPLESYDETRPVVLAFGEVSPVTISDIFALTDLQSFRQTIRPLYHRIVLPAMNAAALETSFCAQIARFNWESLSKSVVKNSTCGFFMEKEHTLILPVREDDHVRIEIAQIDVSGRLKDSQLRHIVKGLKARQPKDDVTIDTPATRYFYETESLAGVLFRGWRLADVGASTGIHNAAVALTAMDGGSWTTQAMEGAVSTIGNGHLFLNSHPAELDDLAVSYNGVSQGHFTFVASLSQKGQQMFLDADSDTHKPVSRRTLQWLGFPLELAVNARYLPSQKSDVDDINQLSECGLSCYLHAIIRAPFSYQSVLSANGLSLSRHTDNFIGGSATGRRVGNALVIRTGSVSRESMAAFTARWQSAFSGIWHTAKPSAAIQPDTALFVALSDLLQKYDGLTQISADSRIDLLLYRIEKIAPLIYTAREIEGHKPEADAIERALVHAALNTKKIIEAMRDEEIAMPETDEPVADGKENENKPEIDSRHYYDGQLKRFLKTACTYHLAYACKKLNDLYH